MSVDVLFIHPGGQRAAYGELAGEFTAVAPPVWTALLAGHVRERGRTVAVHDANAQGWDEETASRLLDERDPALAVMMVYGHHPSASTQTMPAAGRMARDIKRLRPGLPLAMGGLHPSALPARTLDEEAADYVIQGEGSATVVRLLDHLRGAATLDAVPGLWHRRDGRPRPTSPAPPLDRLDEELGDCAWDLLPPLDRYRAHTMHCFQDFARSTRDDFSDVRSPYATLFTSLGCPFSCDYCGIHALHGRREVRYWSLERVGAWIDFLAGERGVRNLRLEDELFVLSPQRVERFCDMLIERGRDLNLWVYGRVDTVKRPLLRKMRRAGITWVCLGIESGSARVLQDVGKTHRADVTAVVRAIQEEGISVLGNFMFGLPEDDLSTMEETLRLARDLRCEYVNFYTVMAYPGSRLYERFAGTPGVLPAGWEGFSQLGYEARPLPTRHLSAREVLRFRDRAFLSYITDPAYLASMAARFGAPVVRHLERLAAVPLRRRLLEEGGE